MRIRKASPDDAAAIVAVWECIAAEKIHSAVDKPWSVEQQTSYLRSLSPREAFHVALDGDGSVVGFQSLDLWSPLFGSMSHVGQVGTFLLPEWQGAVRVLHCGRPREPSLIRPAIESW